MSVHVDCGANERLISFFSCTTEVLASSRLKCAMEEIIWEQADPIIVSTYDVEDELGMPEGTLDAAREATREALHKVIFEDQQSSLDAIDTRLDELLHAALRQRGESESYDERRSERVYVVAAQDKEGIQFDSNVCAFLDLRDNPEIVPDDIDDLMGYMQISTRGGIVMRLSVGAVLIMVVQGIKPRLDVMLRLMQ